MRVLPLEVSSDSSFAANGAAGGGAGAGAGGGANQDPAARAAAQAEREKKVLEILNGDQLKRLKELYIQRASFQALSREDIQKELALSSEQVDKIKDLQTKARDDNTELMTKMRNQEIDRTEGRDIMTKN